VQRRDLREASGLDARAPGRERVFECARCGLAGWRHVLATDGDPNDCSSTPENVAAKAAAVAGDIPTYVIGVGPDTTKLDTSATGGGTSKAIMSATANPSQVSADLRAAVGQIKAAQLGCNDALPAPPAGQSLDVNAVNVDYTPSAEGNRDVRL